MVIVASIMTASGLLNGQSPSYLQTFQNRYEGTFRQPVGDDELSLVSFIVGKVPSYTDDSVLRVTFSAPSTTSVEIVAQELRPVKLYRMESFPCSSLRGSNTFEPWEVQPVLRAQLIDSRNLGVVVRLGPAPTDPITAARVQLIHAPAESSQDYVWVFRSGRSLSSVEYSLSSSTGVMVQAFISDPLIKDEPFGVKIPRGNWPAGIYRLELKSYIQSSNRPFVTALNFYHEDGAPGPSQPCRALRRN